MAGLLFIVSRTKPGTYTYMKLVSESEDVVLFDRREVDRRRIDQRVTPSGATVSAATATSCRTSRNLAGRWCALGSRSLAGAAPMAINPNPKITQAASAC
jgi:hypothetical protein